MGKFSNVVRDSKVLKGLLVALPFLSFTVGAEMAKAAPQAKSSQKKLSRAEKIQHIKKARLAKARLARVHAEKEKQLAKTRSVRKTQLDKARAEKQAQLKKASARFVKTAAKTTPTAKQTQVGKTAAKTTPTAKQTQVGKTAAKTTPTVKQAQTVKPAAKTAPTAKQAQVGKTGSQKTVAAKKVQPVRTIQPRVFQTAVTTNSNKMYARLEAKIDQALNIVKRQAVSKKAASKSSSADATLAAAVDKLGEMLNFFKKQADKKAEKDLVKKVMRKMEKKSGGGLYVTQQQSSPTSLAQSNVSAPEGPQQGISLSAQTKPPVAQAKAPVVQSKASSSPEEIAAQFFGFELNKAYSDSGEATKTLNQRYNAKKLSLDNLMEKTDPDKKPHEFAKLEADYLALDSNKALLTKHLNAKFGGGSTTAEAEPKHLNPPVKRASTLETPQKAPIKKPTPKTPVITKILASSSAPVTAVPITGRVDPTKTLLDALAVVDNTFAKKARLTELLTRVPVDAEKTELVKLEDELFRAAKKTAEATEKKIAEIDEKLSKNTSGVDGYGNPLVGKEALISKPMPAIFGKWDDEAKQLFNAKMAFYDQLASKEYSLMALVGKERLKGLAALNPSDRAELETNGDEFLYFLGQVKTIASKRAGDLLKGPEKTYFTNVSKAMDTDIKALETDADVRGSKVKAAPKKFVPRGGGGTLDFSELSGKVTKID